MARQIAHELGAGADAEVTVHRQNMLVNSGGAAEQLGGDLGFILAGDQVIQDVALAPSEADAADVRLRAEACANQRQEFIVCKVEQGACAGAEH
jgi:hypothetical protein